MAPATGPPPKTSVFSPTLLQGRLCFITGCGSGICKAMTEAFLHHGAAGACIVSRTQERLDAAKKELEGKIPGAKVLAVAADVRKPEEMLEAARKCVEKFGRIDVVVAGAAGNYLTTMEQLSFSGFKTVVDIDLMGTFNTIKVCHPHLKATAKETGFASVIAVSAGEMPARGGGYMGHALAAKAGIDTIIRTVANEWGPQGIRANSLGPGLIDGTEGADRLVVPELKKLIVGSIPLRMAGTLVDMQLTALFLASPASWYITGANIVCAGGSWLSSANPRFDLNDPTLKVPRPVGRGKL